MGVRADVSLNQVRERSVRVTNDEVYWLVAVALILLVSVVFEWIPGTCLTSLTVNPFFNSTSQTNNPWVVLSTKQPSKNTT